MILTLDEEFSLDDLIFAPSYHSYSLDDMRIILINYLGNIFLHSKEGFLFPTREGI